MMLTVLARLSLVVRARPFCSSAALEGTATSTVPSSSPSALAVGLAGSTPPIRGRSAPRRYCGLVGLVVDDAEADGPARPPGTSLAAAAAPESPKTHCSFRPRL